MEEEIQRLKMENELLLAKVKDLTRKRQGAEKYWVIATRFFAFIITVLPFIPNLLFFIGLKPEKTQIGTTEIFFTAIGFALMWGSANFGEWANQIGKKMINKH